MDKNALKKYQKNTEQTRFRNLIPNQLKLKTTILIISLFIGSILNAGDLQYHHNVGLGGAYQGSIGGFVKYDARLNLIGNETWTLGISASPALGAEINRPDQEAFRPIFLIPSTISFNWGMGSSFDCLRYRGYSLKLGLAPSTFGAMHKSIISDNIKSVPIYVGTDFKFQTKKLKTFSFEIGVLRTQMNNSYLKDLGFTCSLNYFLGLY